LKKAEIYREDKEEVEIILEDIKEYPNNKLTGQTR